MTNAKSEFQFHKAVREQIRLLIGLSGGTGSGKTYSAMRLAKGLSGDKRFAVIDTENGRASMYADYFDFDVADLHAPFTPDRYLDAIVAAEKAGYGVIVVDSMSHEWAGDGGILDMQEDELDRLASTNYEKREACKMASWVKPKMAHKSMVAKLLQLRANVIMCFRAEAKIEMKRENGKMVVGPKESLTGLDGWIPITEKNLPYELAASFLLTADRPGIPKPIKLQHQHKTFFPLDKPITEDAGRLIGEWAKGGSPKVEQPALPPPTKPPLRETKPGVYEPNSVSAASSESTDGSKRGELNGAAEWFNKIESADSAETLNEIGVALQTQPLSDDDKKTARQLYAARKKQLSQPKIEPQKPVEQPKPAEEPWI